MTTQTDWAHRWIVIRHAVVTNGAALLILLAAGVGLDAWITVKRALTEKTTQAQQSSPQTPAVTIPVAPVEPKGGIFSGKTSAGFPGGSGKPWTPTPTPTPIVVPAATETVPWAQYAALLDRYNAAITQVTPEYIPPTAADGAAMESKFTFSLKDYRPLAEVEIPVARDGGEVALLQSRLGGVVDARWRPNPRPTVSFRQYFDLYSGFVAEQTITGRDLGGMVGVGWEPVRVGDYHLRVDAEGDLFAGRWLGRGMVKVVWRPRD